MYVKETDKKATYIIEGEEKPGKVFSIKRFICVVAEQETKAETEALADWLLEKINNEPTPF